MHKNLNRYSDKPWYLVSQIEMFFFISQTVLIPFKNIVFFRTWVNKPFIFVLSFVTDINCQRFVMAV